MGEIALFQPVKAAAPVAHPEHVGMIFEDAGGSSGLSAFIVKHVHPTVAQTA